MNVLFDMDGTLLRLEVDIEEVRLRLAALFGPHGVTKPFRPILTRIRDAAKEVGKPELEAAGLAILDQFELDGAKVARPREGARDVVLALKQRGAKLGLVTDNGRACVGAALDAAGIPKDAFTILVTRDDVPVPKPDPTGVNLAKAALGEPIWYVGDHTKDVQAGKAAGVRVAALRGGLLSDDQLAKAGADRIIDRLADVLNLD